MVKILNPLMSISASGTFAKKITFGNNQNGSYVKRFAGNSKIKGNTGSIKQIKDRFYFTQANFYYKTLTNSEILNLKSLYNDPTLTFRHVIFKLFIKEKPTELGFTMLGESSFGSI
jgi:hypothetical protein